MTETQLWQFIFLCNGIFISYEDAFHQHREGLLNEAAFQSFIKAATQALSAPGLRAQWLLLRGTFTNDFAQFIDGLAAGPIPGTDYTELWQEALAKVRAQNPNGPAP